MKKILTLAVVFVLLIPLYSVILPRAYATLSLTNGYVDPGNAPVTTTFYYYATYYDSGGYAPEMGVVKIDGYNGQYMTLYNGIPSNGVYRYGTTLAVGTHNYYFYFNAGGGGGTVYLGYPSSPFSGPIVTPAQRLLTVSCAHDSPNPPNGNWHFDDGQYIACTVTSPVTESGTVWTCAGWTATGSVPHSGTGTSTGYFYITQDSTITWIWQGSAAPVTLTVSSGHGNPVPGNGPHTYNSGDPVTCSVSSPVIEGNTRWDCTGWTGTGSVQSSGSGTSTSFTITQDSSITWNWAGTVTQHTLTVSSLHDSPIPSSGPHTYNDGDPVTCSVTSPVTEGSTVWTCTGWSGSGSVPPSGTQKAVTFTITQDSTITWNWQLSTGQPTIEWNKTYGGTYLDMARSVVQSVDNGYAIAGWTKSFGSDFGFLLVKVDSNGNMQWNATFPGPYGGWASGAYSVIQTSDGGYALTGYGFLLVKTDANGALEWSHTYVDSLDAIACSLIQTSDGGYVLTGYAFSSSESNYGLCLVKVDSSGTMLWTRMYEISDRFNGGSLICSSDGEYVVAGYVWLSDVLGWDVNLVKLNTSGDLEWSRTYNEAGSFDRAYSVAQATDGGFLIGGDTNSTGSMDFLLIKTDNAGNMQWRKTYGGTGMDVAFSLIQTVDGCSVLAGETDSYGNGSTDFWLVKTDADGNVQWSQTHGGTGWDNANSVIQTDDGGYAVAGYTESFGAGSDFWLIKMTSEGSTVQRRLTVNSAHDSPSPSVGDHSYGDGSSVTCSVLSPVTEGSTIWICTGWTGTGSVPSSGSGSSVTFTISQDSSITWNWQAVPIQYGLLVQISGSGTTNATGTTMFDSGTIVSVQASPSNGWLLNHWLRNGSNVGSTNPYTVTMNENINLTAVFTLIQPTQWKLTVSSTHDSPNPGNGDHYYNDGFSVTCSVTSPVTEGNIVWTCNGWSGSGSVPSSSSGNSIAFTITQDSTITWNWQGTPVQRTLTVSSAHGSPNPGNGPHTYSDGQCLTCSVISPVTEGSTSWTCTGWTGTGSVPSSGSGKTVTFSITQDSSITWNWQGQAIYSVTAGAHCNTEGKDVSVSIWIDSSTAYYTPYTFSNLHGTHTFTASQYDTNSHSFKQWNTGSTSLTIAVSSGGTYTAYYEALQRTLTVSSAHDSPVPSNGPHTYTDGQSVTCSASSTVTEGSTVWTCTGWSGTGSVPSSGSGTSTSFIITKDSTITWNWQARPIGDLILVDFSPVQVVYGASELVANKAAVFRAIVQSTFSLAESTIIRFTYSGGSSTDYPLQIGPNTQMTVFISFASNTLHQRGTFAWSASLDPDGRITETNESNNMITGSKTVVETNYLSVLYVPLRSSLDTPVSTADMQLMEKYGDQYILETFPTPGVYSQIYYPSPGVLVHDDILTLLGTLQGIDKVAKQAGFDRTVVIVPNMGGHWLVDRIPGVSLFGDPAGWTPNTGTGPWSIVIVENKYYAAIPHELAHTYGRPGGSAEEYNTNPPGNHATGYDVGRSKEIKNGLCFMSNTVPLARLGDAIEPIWGKPPIDYGLFADGYWICNTCYEALLGQFKKAGDPEVMYMGGVIFENDTILLPTWSRVSYGVPDLPLGNTGNLRILFLDDTGNIIGQTGLNASFVYFSDEYYITAFSLAVEYPDATREIQLLLDDNVVVERNVTLHSPTVSVISPNGEVVTAGDDCLISWNSTDLDGDQLTYDLFYSEDGGGHWTPVAMDLNQTTFLWNTSGLDRGSNYLVKVVANDGLNTGENISDSTFTIRVHDIAPTIIIPSKSFVGQSLSISLNITVENQGDFIETLNMTLYANETAIGDIQNISLNSENLTIYFTWNTTGFEYGNYTLSAYAWPVPGETDTADNNFTYGLVSVTIMGDIDGNGWVNVLDAIDLSNSFGKSIGQAGFNPNADFDDNGIVNILDAITLANHYNQHYP
jgi:hypothetical protein